MVEADSKPKLVDALPQLATEIKLLLAKRHAAQLEPQVNDLRIVDRCRCGDDFCASFYTQPKAKGGYGHGLRNLVLDPQQGMIVLDVVAGSIVYVEVLNRDEIRRELHKAVP